LNPAFFPLQVDFFTPKVLKRFRRLRNSPVGCRQPACRQAGTGSIEEAKDLIVSRLNLDTIASSPSKCFRVWIPEIFQAALASATMIGGSAYGLVAEKSTVAPKTPDSMTIEFSSVWQCKPLWSIHQKFFGNSWRACLPARQGFTMRALRS